MRNSRQYEKLPGLPTGRPRSRSASPGIPALFLHPDFSYRAAHRPFPPGKEESPVRCTPILLLRLFQDAICSGRPCHMVVVVRE